MENKSYLKRLKFDPKLKIGLIAKYLANPRLVFLLLFTIFTLGITSYLGLPHRLNPEIKIPIIIVSTVLPGANPQDIESLVTQPLESEVTGLTNVKTVTSTSQENVSVISIEFASGTDPERARTDVQSAVDQAKLPTDAQSPKVQKVDFENQPIWSFALTANGDVPSLNKFAKILKKELEDLPSISSVATNGMDEQEISVLIELKKISPFKINPFQLSQLIKTATGSYPAGNVETLQSSFALSIDPSVTSVDELRNIQVGVNGKSVPLSDIATISQKSKPNIKDSYYASLEKLPERTIRFDVFKTSTADIDKSTKDAEKKVDEILSNYQGRFQIKSIVNAGAEIDDQFTELIRDFTITTFLVFLVLLVFLGIRQALVSFLAVPLTFLISFSAMSVLGISLNFLSMFSLLLSLGLLVDDTIVVISAMSSYYKSGKFTPLETGLLVWRDFFTPILTTTLTTVWAFLPLLISTGIIGEFIKSIPIVVSATLLGSLVVGMLVTLPLMILLLKPTIPRRIVIFLRVIFFIGLLGIFFIIVPKGTILIFEILALLLFLFVTANVRLLLVRRSSDYLKDRQKKSKVIRQLPRYVKSGLISFDNIGHAYRRVLQKILVSGKNRRKAVVMVVIFSLFSYFLVPLGFVKNEFFPKSDQNYLFITNELPAGTNLNTLREEGLNFLNDLRKTPDTSYVIADLGKSFTQDFGSAGGGSNTILYSLVLPKRKERASSSIDIAESIRQKYSPSAYTKGKLTVSEVSGGPPAGADVQIKIFGNDLTVLQQYADKVVSYLEGQKGISSVSKSIKEGTSKLTFTPDPTKLAVSGITRDQLGLWLRTFASGFTLDSLKLDSNDTEDSDISLRLGSSIQTVENIYSLQIPTPQGSVPLAALGHLVLKPNPTLITREDGKRTISITAGVSPGASTSTINKNIEKFADTGLRLPDGYSWKTGGVNEENQKSVASILQAMLLSFILILVTMVIQFSSFRKAIIVMLVIPLSVSGVFILFALTGTPLSFPAIIGILALFGIVVKNSILIVDKITANQKTGMTFLNSIVDASESRLEPIALTSAAAIMGLIPITLSNPLWRGLGGAIIAGLTFSGTIMLFFIPIVYYYWFRPENEKGTVQARIKRRDN